MSQFNILTITLSPLTQESKSISSYRDAVINIFFYFIVEYFFLLNKELLE